MCRDEAPAIAFLQQVLPRAQGSGNLMRMATAGVSAGALGSGVGAGCAATGPGAPAIALQQQGLGRRRLPFSSRYCRVHWALRGVSDEHGDGGRERAAHRIGVGDACAVSGLGAPTIALQPQVLPPALGSRSVGTCLGTSVGAD